VNTNNSVKWMWVKVPKIQHINVYLFIDTWACKSNEIKIDMNEMTIGLYWIKQRSMVNTGDISPKIADVNPDFVGKEQWKGLVLQLFLGKEMLKNHRQVSLM